MQNNLSQAIENEFGIKELKAIKKFLDYQNLLLDLKLKELENDKPDFGDNQISAGIGWMKGFNSGGKK